MIIYNTGVYNKGYIGNVRKDRDCGNLRDDCGNLIDDLLHFTPIKRKIIKVYN